MIRDTLIVTSLSLGASILGFLSQLLFARTFGASVGMDVYFTILSIPTIFTGLAPVAFTGVLVPYLINFKHNTDERENFVKVVFIYIIFFSLSFILIGIISGIIITSRHLHKLNMPFDSVIISLIILIWLSSGMSLVNSFFASIHNSKNLFSRVAVGSLFPPLIIVLSVLLLGHDMGVMSVAFGYFLGTVAQMALLFVKIIPRNGLSGIIIKLNSQQILLFKKFIPVIISLIPFTVVGSISYYWASFLPIGSISLIAYSQSFAGILSVASGLGVATVSLPFIASGIINEVEDKSVEYISQYLKYILILSIFGATIIYGIKTEMIELLYEHGSFSESSSSVFSGLLVWYLIGAVFAACLNLIRNYFYSRDENVVLAKISIFIPPLFILISGILSNYYSVNGIGMAYAITNVIFLFILIMYVKNDNAKLLSKELVLFFLNIVLMALIVSFAASKLRILFLTSIPILGILIIQVAVIMSLFIGLSIKVFKVKEIIIVYKLIIKYLKLA